MRFDVALISRLQLGVAVSLIHEHVLLPPSAPMSVDEPLYAERVAFQLYVVSNHGSYDADGPDGLALKA